MKKVFLYTMLAQAVYWIVSAFLLGSSPSIVINILMAADGLCFGIFAFLYNKNLFLMIMTALFLAVNLVLTFTDQMGLWDFIILAANIVCIASFTFIMAKGHKAKSKNL